MSKKKEFIPNYKTFTNDKNLVKVGCSYAGKMYYGIAKCAPEDTFDYDFGYRLAKARCDFAICTAKLSRSQSKIDMYRGWATTANEMLEDELKYEQKLHQQWEEAFEELAVAYK